METQFDIAKLIDKGEIQSELELERALIADRQLRKLSKEDEHFKLLRKKLRNLIETYEDQNWSADANISDNKIAYSESAILAAEKERLFVKQRKELILNKLKKLNLTQQDFGKILGHPSKSYMSELMNGISPFTLKDIVVIHQLLQIELNDLIPTFIPQSELLNIKETIKKLNNPKLQLW